MDRQSRRSKRQRLQQLQEAAYPAWLNRPDGNVRSQTSIGQGSSPRPVGSTRRRSARTTHPKKLAELIRKHDGLFDHSVWRSGPNHYIPHHGQSLDELCRALMENDPNVTSFSTERLPVPFARKLGWALCGSNSDSDSDSSIQRNNTVVSEIRLASDWREDYQDAGVSFNVDDEERDENFEHWLKTSTSLHSIKVCFRQAGEFQWIYPILHSNRAICHVGLKEHVALTPLTNYVMTATWLQSLGLSLHGGTVYEAHQLQALGRAIGNHGALQKLHLSGDKLGSVLEQLSRLESSLSELALELPLPNPLTVDSLLNFVHFSAQKLQCLVLRELAFDDNLWQRLSTALTANAGVAILKLYFCNFTEEAADLFVAYMQGQGRRTVDNSDPPVVQPLENHLQELHLMECTKFSGQQVAAIFCSSPLDHIVLDVQSLTVDPTADNDEGRAEHDAFFDHWTDHATAFRQIEGTVQSVANTSVVVHGEQDNGSLAGQDTVEGLADDDNVEMAVGPAEPIRSVGPIRCVTLKYLDHRTMQRLSEFLPVVTYLRSLTLELDDASWRSTDELSNATDLFLTGLRGNGSVHVVQLPDACNVRDKKDLDLVRAITTRNRVLPGLLDQALQSSSSADANGNEKENEHVHFTTVSTAAVSTNHMDLTGTSDDSGGDIDSPDMYPRPLRSVAPLLGRVATRAASTAPNLLLRSFLQASEALLQSPSSPSPSNNKKEKSAGTGSVTMPNRK